MASVQRVMLRASDPWRHVEFGANGATVTAQGATVYYRSTLPVDATTNDGSIVDGSSTTLTGSWYFATTADRADLQVLLLDVVLVGSTSGLAALSLGNSIMAIGDSLTDADNPANGGIEVYPQIGTRSYLAWATLLAGGRLRYRGVSATSGYTAAQVRATHLPVVLAASPKPAFCAVLAGRNSGVSLAQDKTDIEAMWDALTAAGIQPVACTLPPSNLAPATATEHELQAWIVTRAQRKGLPCADFYSALVAQAGGYSATAGGTSYGFEGSNPVHQSAAGAKVMGQVLFDAIAPRLSVAPWILPAQGAADTTALYTNPLFLTDTDANGRPDGWQAPAGTPTIALVTDATVGKGKVMKITKNTGTMDMYGDGWNVTAGHRLLVSTKVQATVQNADATRDNFTVEFMRQDLAAVALNFNFARDVPAGAEFAAEIVVPVGYTGLRPHIQFGGGGVAGSILQLAQFTCVDLTAMGF